MLEKDSDSHARCCGGKIAIEFSENRGPATTKNRMETKLKQKTTVSTTDQMPSRALSAASICSRMIPHKPNLC